MTEGDAADASRGGLIMGDWHGNRPKELGAGRKKGGLGWAAPIR